jgi:uncharacterized protein YkwD
MTKEGAPKRKREALASLFCTWLPVPCSIAVRMAVLLGAIGILTCGALGATTNRVSALKKSGARHVALTIESEVLAELNMARQKPKEYARYVEEHRRRMKNDGSYSVPGGLTMTSREGIKAVEEAIVFLKQVKPVGPLDMSVGLSRAARDHVDDLGPKGQVGHGGTDGSTPSERVTRYGDWDVTTGENIACGFDDARMIVVQLIVDDGVPLRGHRENIFQPKYKTVGIACGNHKTFRHMCVMDFAGGFRENKAFRDAAKKASR